jgi:DNA-directed RNA polymerase subunit M/transcription elongation factor TFIIS
MQQNRSAFGPPRQSEAEKSAEVRWLMNYMVDRDCHNCGDRMKVTKLDEKEPRVYCSSCQWCLKEEMYRRLKDMESRKNQIDPLAPQGDYSTDELQQKAVRADMSGSG